MTGPVVIGDATLYCADCLEVLRGLPSGSVDAVITDPPYGTTRSEWDRVPDLKALWAQWKRVLRPLGAAVMTTAQPFTTDAINAARGWFKYDLIWNKRTPRGHLNAKVMPLRQHETILVFGAGRTHYEPQMRTGPARWKGRGRADVVYAGCYGVRRNNPQFSDQYHPTSVLEFSSGGQVGKSHPNEKPVDLFRWLVRTYCPAGGVILDPFVGSGTTGVVAIQTGRRFIGIEKSPEYFDVACRRIETAYSVLPKAA